MRDMRGVDLSTFQFDFDETWAAFLMNAHGRIYARVFGRDHTSSLSHRSLEGLAATLKAVLEVHKREAAEKPEPQAAVKWRRIDDVPAYRRWRKPADCVHCHFVAEDLRRQQYADGTWKPANIWSYPPPENWGLTMDWREPVKVESVATGSFAARAGLRAGDVLRQIGDVRVLSWGDIFYAIDRSPDAGDVRVAYAREGREAVAALKLEGQWRRSDLAWRASLAKAEPHPGMTFRGLDPAEKRALGLADDALAGRVMSVSRGGAAQWAGIEKNDVLVSLAVGDRVQTKALDDRHLQAWFRTQCAPGDRVTVEILRAGARRETTLDFAK